MASCSPHSCGRQASSRAAAGTETGWCPSSPPHQRDALPFGPHKELPTPKSCNSGWQMGKLSPRTGGRASGKGWTDLQEGAEHIQLTLALERGIPHEPHHSCREHRSGARPLAAHPPQGPSVGRSREAVARAAGGFSSLKGAPCLSQGQEASEDPRGGDERGQIGWDPPGPGPWPVPPHT